MKSIFTSVLLIICVGVFGQKVVNRPISPCKCDTIILENKDTLIRHCIVTTTDAYCVGDWDCNYSTCMICHRSWACGNSSKPDILPFKQKKDSAIININRTTKGTSYGDIKLGGTLISTDTTFLITQKDTVDVIALVSDTTMMPLILDKRVWFNWKSPNGERFAIKCKAVRENHIWFGSLVENGVDYLVDAPHDNWQIAEYLLPKKYIVWQSIIINKTK